LNNNGFSKEAQMIQSIFKEHIDITMKSNTSLKAILEGTTAKKYINEARGLSQIAAEIRSDWKNVNYAAKPYLDAMRQLNSINDKYYSDSARSVVAYFLSNASSWRGEKAKAPKPIEHCFKNNLRVASCASSKWASSARLNLLLFMTQLNF
jgi:hypothetical protein